MALKFTAQQKRPLWALSMGDLMTLILSFFLSIIASSLQRATYPQQVGTPIAVSSYESDQRLDWSELDLEQDSFELSQVDLTEQARNRLEIRVKSLSNDVSEVVVRGCLPLENKGVSDPWYVSIGRTLAVVRQIVDTGVPRERLTVEPATKCSTAVKIEFVAKNHG